MVLCSVGSAQCLGVWSIAMVLWLLFKCYYYYYNHEASSWTAVTCLKLTLFVSRRICFGVPSERKT